MNDLDEEKAIKGVIEGDSDCFTILYNRYYNMVYGIVHRILKVDCDTQDLVQEIFTQLYINIDKFSGHCRFSTWLYRLSINKTLMYLRNKETKRKALSLSLNRIILLENNEVTLESVIAVQDTKLMESVNRIVIDDGIKLLASRYRQTLVLRDVLGFNTTETAEMLKCSEGNVKSQLHKARKRLKEYVESST